MKLFISILTSLLLCACSSIGYVGNMPPSHIGPHEGWWASVDSVSGEFIITKYRHGKKRGVELRFDSTRQVVYHYKCHGNSIGGTLLYSERLNKCSSKGVKTGWWLLPLSNYSYHILFNQSCYRSSNVEDSVSCKLSKVNDSVILFKYKRGLKNGNFVILDSDGLSQSGTFHNGHFINMLEKYNKEGDSFSGYVFDKTGKYLGPYLADPGYF